MAKKEKPKAVYVEGLTQNAVRDIYLRTEGVLEQMSKEYGIPLTALEQLARTDNLSALPQNAQKQRLQALDLMRDGLLVDKQSTVQRMEMLQLMRINLRLAEIEAHFKRYGDFYVRNSDDEVLYDGRGQPIELTLPTTPNELLILKGLEDIRESNKKLVDEANGAAADKAKKVKAIDVDGYGLFKREEGDE